MSNKLKKFFKHLKNRDFFRGAAVIFWKKENGKKYVLLSKRSCGYGKSFFSNQGGHQDSVDFENNKWIYINTAVRESSEETKVVRQYGKTSSLADKQKALIKARKFFFENSDFIFNEKPIRNFNIGFYHHVTYECLVTGKMADEKWYAESHESIYGTMKWYALDNLPKKILFACRLNILYIKLFCK
ncbi:MAG: hypothetical protein MJ184_09175 [Treponema sp.]|uniref:hypothetical protein n=1 Tax=Treponema sp. TaxID=166 RepID=UPI00298D73C4|nr:hypothetical protein [Treponema sp.]MCQ2601515.1 hypothetical protein [Treponema sp.]